MSKTTIDISPRLPAMNINQACSKVANMVNQTNSAIRARALKNGVPDYMVQVMDVEVAIKACRKRINRFYGLNNKYNADGSLKDV